MPNHLHAFADFLTQTKFDDIPEPAVKRAKLIIADCIAAIVGGSAEAENQALETSIMRHGCARILGGSNFSDAQSASLMNGTAGTALEMDEGHQFARGHPGMHVFPALLAASDTADAPVTGQEFLQSFILGYDIAARIGLATNLNPHMHPHGTWGVIGAASAIGVLNRLDRQKIIELINISSSFSLATSRKTMLEGGTVRNSYTGISNQMAHLAYQILQAGFSGEKDGIGSVFGNIVSSSFDTAAALDALGTRFEVTRNYFKLHACCRYNHAALDALWLLMEQYSELQNPENIAHIDVESYFLAAELTDPKPRNMLAARFSVPFAVATSLINRSSKIQSFTQDMLEKTKILALAAKTSIKENSDMSAQLPDYRPASICITMQDGSTYRASVKTNRGDWRDPYSEAALKEKYNSLTARRWSPAKRNALYTRILNLEHALDLKETFTL